MPPDDYMDGEDQSMGTAPAPEIPVPKEDDGGQTALISKSVLGDRECKPGEKLTFEVVKVYDDEVEVKATYDKPEPEAPAAEEVVDESDPMME